MKRFELVKDDKAREFMARLEGLSHSEPRAAKPDSASVRHVWDYCQGGIWCRWCGTVK